MKNFILCIVIIIIGLVSCEKSEPDMIAEPNSNTGTAHALMDSVPYEGLSSCYIQNFYGFGEGLYISFKTYSQVNFPRTNLRFFAVPMQKGIYFAETSFNVYPGQVQKTACVFSFSFGIGDEAGPVYQITDEENTWIKIDSINTVTGTVLGQFQANLKIGAEDAVLFPEADSTVNFINGTFDVKIAPQ